MNQKRNKCHDEFDNKHRNPCNQFCRSITPSDRSQVKEKVENDNKVCPCINFFDWSRFDCVCYEPVVKIFFHPCSCKGEL